MSDLNSPAAPSDPDARSATESSPEMISARIDRVPVGRFHIKMASILATGTFFDGFDAISLAVVIPIIVSSFGIGFEEVGLIVSAGYVGQFIGAIIVGALADRAGRRMAFIVALTVFGALSIGCALAWSADSLLVFRLLQGLGLGAEVPIAGTLFNEYLGRRNRGRVSVIYQSAFTWGLFFAPLVGLLLTANLPPEMAWRVLLGLGALPLLAAVWALVSLPESARWLAARGRTDEAEKYVQVLEAEAIAHGVQLPPPTAGPVLDRSPFRPVELFRGQYGRRTVMLATLWFTTFFVSYGWAVWLPTLYVSVGQLSPTQSLVLTVIGGAVQLVMAYVSAWLIERVGRKASLAVGFLIATLGGLFGFVNITLLGNSSWQILFIAGIVMTIGSVIPSVSLYLYTSELYPTRMRGFATSAASSVARIASIISPIVIGSLLATGGAGLIFGLLAALALVGGLVIRLAGVETRNRSLEEISA